ELATGQLAAVGAANQCEVDCRAARMTGALGDVAVAEQGALVDVRIELGLALDVVDALRPAHEMGDRALRPIAVERFEREPAHPARSAAPPATAFAAGADNTQRGCW